MEVVLIQKVRRMIGNCHIYVGQTTLRFERGYFFQSRFDIAVRVVFNDFHKNQLAASPQRPETVAQAIRMSGTPAAPMPDYWRFRAAPTPWW